MDAVQGGGQYNWLVRGALSTTKSVASGRQLLRARQIIQLATLVCTAWLCLYAPALAETSYNFTLEERIYPNKGAIAQVGWLDNSNYLTLALAPGGTEIFQHSYPTTTLPQVFMSADFMRNYVCDPELAGRLSWRLSPRKNYLFFSWFTDEGDHQWRLFDISAAPRFQLKNFEPPAGMSISHVLFSPDDRYAVFIHDSMRGESDISVLVLDLQTGSELWRLTTQQVNFISELWWGGAIYDAPRFFAAAKLHDGQFEPHNGLAAFDLETRTLDFAPQDQGVICGDQTLWGKLICYATDDPQTPYVLTAKIPGQEQPRQIALSAQPVRLEALPAPGFVLLSNTEDRITNQLWLIDVFAGEKALVDEDCAGFALCPNGKLLVWARTRIELRVYSPVAAED